jgi:hypothetical protein
MKKTVKYILGAAVTLAITAPGAFATPVMITQLPVQIVEPGDYILAPEAVAQPVTAAPVILQSGSQRAM